MTLKCKIYTLVYLGKTSSKPIRLLVEDGVFAAEEVAEGIADEAGVADCQVGEMMGMTVDPCRDSTVCDIVAEFGGVGSVEYTAFMFIFNSCECWEVVSDNDYFLGVAVSHSLFDELRGYASKSSLMFCGMSRRLKYSRESWALVVYMPPTLG